jgi:hypothetical protein
MPFVIECMRRIPDSSSTRNRVPNLFLKKKKPHKSSENNVPNLTKKLKKRNTNKKNSEISKNKI